MSNMRRIIISCNCLHTKHSKITSVCTAPSKSKIHFIRSLIPLIGNKDTLPSLNQAQITKLKHLSLVSLAMERRVRLQNCSMQRQGWEFVTNCSWYQILPYADLLESLEMPTIRELEDLIIDAIYQDVIRGKLDQKEQQFEVEYTMGRDLEPGKIENVLAALQAWCAFRYPSDLSCLTNENIGRTQLLPFCRHSITSSQPWLPRPLRNINKRKNTRRS